MRAHGSELRSNGRPDGNGVARVPGRAAVGAEPYAAARASAAGARSPWAREFDAWAEAALSRFDTDALLDFRTRGPGAREALPTWEHYAPLLVVAGAAADGPHRARFPITGTVPSGAGGDPGGGFDIPLAFTVRRGERVLFFSRESSPRRSRGGGERQQARPPDAPSERRSLMAREREGLLASILALGFDGGTEARVLDRADSPGSRG